MEKFKEFNVGDQFHSSRSGTYTITKFNTTIDDSNPMIKIWTGLAHIDTSYKIFKNFTERNEVTKVDNVPIIKTDRTSSCQHTNTRKDSFFSARVYLTCIDCGKSLG